MIHRDIKDENILVVNANTNFPFIRPTSGAPQPGGRGVGGVQKVLHHQKVSSSNSHNNSSQSDDVSQIVPSSSLSHQKLSTAPSAMTANLQQLMGSPATTALPSEDQQFAPGILAFK